MDDIAVNADDALNELASHVASLAKENAILRAQLKATQKPQIQSETP